MTRILKTILMLVAVAVVTSTPLYAARVNNVQLSHQDDMTVARIEVEGTIRFTHQTEIAKDGKPFRVILDVLSATHNLGAQTFLDLPNCVVEHIRTSQYQVKPEKVVRLVFDMKSETPYRVESDPKSVTLYFNDKSSPYFATWSSAKVAEASNDQKPQQPSAPMAQAPANEPAKSAPAKTVVEKNASIESDRQASLSPAPSAPQTSATPKPTPVQKSTAKVANADEPYGPALMAPAETPAKVDSKPTVAQQPAAKKPVEPPSKPVAQSPQTEAKSAPQPNADKPAVAQAPKKESPATSDAQPKASVKKDEDKSPAVAKAEKNDDKDDKNRSTARFRRNVDRKIQGTIVAEFPKRLVIKYKATGRRDPFETLINESKTVNNPIERRIPNVDGLRLVGVIQGASGTNSALCEDKDDYGYILKAGDKVQRGYVLRVADDRVYFQIFEYGWSRTVALNLQEY